jgi:hypothetical protein
LCGARTNTTGTGISPPALAFDTLMRDVLGTMTTDIHGQRPRGGLIPDCR